MSDSGVGGLLGLAVGLVVVDKVLNDRPRRRKKRKAPSDDIFGGILG
jgi:hypothetical protein